MEPTVVRDRMVRPRQVVIQAKRDVEFVTAILQIQKRKAKKIYLLQINSISSLFRFFPFQIFISLGRLGLAILSVSSGDSITQILNLFRRWLHFSAPYRLFHSFNGTDAYLKS